MGSMISCDIIGHIFVYHIMLDHITLRGFRGPLALLGFRASGSGFRDFSSGGLK